MRIGIDALNLAADRRGMGRFVRSVLRSLGEMDGVEPVLLVRTVADVDRLSQEFACPIATIAEVRRMHCDVQWYPWNGIRFAPMARSAVTVHDLFAFAYPARNIVARLREQRPILRAVRHADGLSAVSRWTAQSMSDRFGIARQHITVLPPILDPWWHPVDVAARTPYVLYVAGPERRKGADLIFTAFEAAFRGGAIELVVAGSMNASQEAAFAALRIKRRRVFPSDEMLRELYAAATAVAVPSIEGVGLAALEAMACGAPVIARNAAALPETCDGAALLAGDLDEWIDALRRVTEDTDLRAALRERGFARIARIDPHATARTLLESLQRSSVNGA